MSTDQPTSPTATPPTSQDVVSETDKPFILILIGTGALVAVLVYGVVTGTDTGKASDVLSPLVGLGWGYYFKAKAP